MNHEFSIASIDYYKQEMCGYVSTEIIFLTKHIFCNTKCMDNYIDAIKNHYFDFSGRATRTQFWMFVLVNIFSFGGYWYFDVCSGQVRRQYAF